ncbi:GNAT family N-acetyltransferase [Streptomyces sporangiiformans]|uniref:GNAT family N-acetyltransferase n=1 Tax=Streptomyces sporangiiformans TaxID=2315329 RepID=A0A505D8C2_9ACTN|nr:GNAT family N-acetyltransferase [Streptomyces sporangiiformans]TPQ19944.1 GNAT family N-acetyltransferase [Streptomyces sporangiiformans]
MGPDDLPYVVAEHLRHFPDGFFARLGSKFLTAYNRTYLTCPDARAYIAEMGGQPVGFLVGATDPAAHRRHVLRDYGRGLLFRALGSLCLRPRLALHFLRTRLVRYGRKLIPSRAAPQSPAAGPSGVTAVLDYVVVAEHARGRGTGARLIARFVKEATDVGCARVTLVTTAQGGAGPYYDRLGWRHQGEIRTPEGRVLLTYDLPLNEGTTSERH